MLTILHAGWPGGFVLGGILLLSIPDATSWSLKVVIILIPVMLYGIMLFKCKFPISERVVSGVSYRDMLREAGAPGCLIVCYLIIMEVNRLFGAGNILQTQFFNLPLWPMTIVLANTK